MGKPRNWSWNPVSQRWENVGRDGIVKAYIDETGLGANVVAVGSHATFQGGTNVQYMLGFTGTNAGLTGIVAYGGAVSVGTITGGTGLAVGDKVFGVRKNTNLQTGLLTSQFYVPTTNTLNIHVGNLGTGAGSLPAGGWDILAIRTA